MQAADIMPRIEGDKLRKLLDQGESVEVLDCSWIFRPDPRP